MSELPVFNSFSHLKRILGEFDELIAAARVLPSPNAEDDEFIRCGMVAFARHVSLTNWEFEHYDYVRVIRDEMSGRDFTLRWRQFACLAAGYFLGMASAGLLNDVDLRASEAQTPGFMWLHSESFCTDVDNGN